MTAPCSRLPQHRGLRLVPFPPPQLLLLLLAAVGPARGWESGDLELFDLVEEVQLNFYQFLGVQQVSRDAGLPEGGASGTETCGSRRKGGGWGGLCPGFLRENRHCGHDLVILVSGCPRQRVHRDLSSLRQP